MELTYNELKKRDVINVVDGKSLGKITDIKFRFPQGVIEGITVEGRRVFFLCRPFNKSNIYIPDKNIIKIGGDVILVDLRCGGYPVADEGKKPCHQGGPSRPPHSRPPLPPYAREERGEEEDGGINFDRY